MNNKIFLDNKYTKYYYQIVNLAQEKKRKRGEGIARHHIIPAHFYVDNNRKEKDEAKLTTGWLLGNPDEKSNLVYLTHREHLICHLLLRKMIEVEKRAGCIYAAWRMVNYELEDGSIIKCNSRLYDKIRTEVSATHSATMKGREPWNKGKKEERPEVLAKIKAAANERPEQTPQQREKQAQKTRGQKRSKEWKEEHSKLLTVYYEENGRRAKTEDEKEHLSKVLTGVPKPKGMGEKLSATVAKQKAEGTHYSQQKKLCPHCGTLASSHKYNPFHGDNCCANINGPKYDAKKAKELLKRVAYLTKTLEKT